MGQKISAGPDCIRLDLHDVLKRDALQISKWSHRKACNKQTRRYQTSLHSFIVLRILGPQGWKNSHDEEHFNLEADQLQRKQSWRRLRASFRGFLNCEQSASFQNRNSVKQWKVLFLPARTAELNCSNARLQKFNSFPIIRH